MSSPLWQQCFATAVFNGAGVLSEGIGVDPITVITPNSVFDVTVAASANGPLLSKAQVVATLQASVAGVVKYITSVAPSPVAPAAGKQTVRISIVDPATGLPVADSAIVAVRFYRMGAV